MYSCAKNVTALNLYISCYFLCTVVPKMLHTRKLKIMELFFEEPTKNFQLREISRLTDIAVTSVRKYLKELLDERLVRKSTKTLYPSYLANESNRMFKVYKQQRMIFKIYLSGLVDYLEETALPNCIILFGSVRKGEYTKKSDIDIFVQSSEHRLKLRKFEKKLNHKINVLFEADLKDLSKELFNNIVNGIVLSGHLKLKR